jgi:hydrogenase-4 membrane subunit HyfE
VVEIAATLDVLIVATVLGLLTRRIRERTGSTAVGDLNALRERSQP